MAEYPVGPLIRIRDEMMSTRDYSGGLRIPDGSTFKTVSDPESITGESVVISTPLGAVFHVRLLRADDVPPADVPPGGIRPVVNERLAEIERGRNNLLSAVAKMMHEYYHPQAYPLDQMLTDLGLTLPGGGA